MARVLDENLGLEASWEMLLRGGCSLLAQEYLLLFNDGVFVVGSC